MATMDIEAFLKRENIPFMYLRNEWDDMNTLTTDEISKWSQLGIRLVIKPNPDGTQKKIHIPNFTKRPDSKWLSVFLKHTDVFCLDIDDKEFDIKNLPEPFQSMPYTLSRNSKLRHCFFRSNCPEYSQEVEVFKHCKADLIHYKKNMWEVIGWEIQQYNGELPFINWNDIKSHFDIKKMNFYVKAQSEECIAKEEDTESVCSQATTSSVVKDDFMYIKKELADDYQSWFNLACIAKFNDIDYEIFDEWSRQSESKYNEKKNRDIWDKIKLKECIRKDVGKAVLNRYIKQGKEEEAKKEAMEGKDIAEDDSEASDIIIKKLEGRLKSCCGLWFRHKNIWISSADKKSEIYLRDWIKRYGNIYFLSEKGNPIKKSGTTIHPKNWVETIKERVMVDNEDTSFRDKLIESQKAKLCYKNGVLDFKTKTFTEWDNITEEVFSTFTISYNYIQPSEEDMELVKNHIFIPIFGDKYEYALRCLSRAMAGHYEDKTWFLFSGQRNCGKGVINKAFKEAFEKYVSTFNPDELVYKKTNSSSNVNLNWLIDLEFSRIAFGNELSTDKNVKLNGGLIKNICSGGDGIQVRSLYQSQREIFIPSSIVVSCNKVPPIEPLDTLEECIGFNFNNKFILKEEYEKRKIELSEKALSLYRVADKTIKDKIKLPQYKSGLIGLLLYYYQDEQLIKQNDFQPEEGDDLAERVRKTFEASPSSRLSNDILKREADNLGTNRQTLVGILEANFDCKTYKSGPKRGIEGVKLTEKVIDDDDKPEIEI
jgi:hypothetical protein